MRGLISSLIWSYMLVVTTARCGRLLFVVLHTRSLCARVGGVGRQTHLAPRAPRLPRRRAALYYNEPVDKPVGIPTPLCGALGALGVQIFVICVCTYNYYTYICAIR
jgi:hypothetical protein